MTDRTEAFRAASLSLVLGEIVKRRIAEAQQLRADLAAATARAEAAETDHDALVDTIDRLLIAVYDLGGFKKCPEVIDHAETVMRPYDRNGLVGVLREKRGFVAPQEQGDE